MPRAPVAALLAAAVLAALLGAALLAPAAGAGPGSIAGTYRNGASTLRLQASGAYTVSQGGAVLVRGKARVRGQRLDLRDTAGPRACRGSQAKAVYTWGGDPQQFLLFLAVTEPCAARKAVLAAGIWKRSYL